MAVDDINNNGIKDLVTGKRYAYMGRDPGGEKPAVLYRFELRRPENKNIEFIPHQINDDSGIGAQFEVIDMNDDNRPDIIISNKKGVYMFLKQTHIRPKSDSI